MNHQLNQYLKNICFLVVIGCGLFVNAQLSKTHYIPPLTNARLGNAYPNDQFIYISTPSTAEVNYTVKPVGLGVSGYISGVVSNQLPIEIPVATDYDQLFVQANQTSTVMNNKGFIIEADSPIYVSIRMLAGGGTNPPQAGALVSKGLAALGTVFRAGMYNNESPQNNYLNFISVMATEDNTIVNFSDIPANVLIDNYNGTKPVTTTLNKGESYIVATTSENYISSNPALDNRAGLIGALVTSDKPIVVNCGSANGSFHNGNGRDYGIDQIVGLSKVGTDYIFVKGDGENDWENVLIVAHYDNTSININGIGPVATINAGDFFIIEGNNFSPEGNMYVQASNPVFAYQGIGATASEANQGMFFVPPLSCETKGNIDNIPFIDSIGSAYFPGGVTIVTKVGATLIIKQNGVPITSNIQGPLQVSGNPDYVTYKATGIDSNISVECDDELYCAYFNYNSAATSGSFYSGFPSPPEINFMPNFNALGICLGNITLEVANENSFDSFEWYYDDGSGYVPLEILICNFSLQPLEIINS